MKYPKFRGVRNILEGEADDWLNQESVHRGLGTLYAVFDCICLTLRCLDTVKPLWRDTFHLRIRLQIQL